MLEEGTALTAIVAGWERHQAHLVDALAPLTPEQLALSAAPHLRSIGALVGHIVAARVNWFHGFLGEGGEELEHLSNWEEDDAPDLSAADLVAGLDTTWRVMKDALARWTAAELAEECLPRYWPSKDYRPSRRQWVVWHVLEHDVHHGGELSYSLGMYGLQALDV